MKSCHYVIALLLFVVLSLTCDVVTGSNDSNATQARGSKVTGIFAQRINLARSVLRSMGDVPMNYPLEKIDGMDANSFCTVVSSLIEGVTALAPVSPKPMTPDFLLGSCYLGNLFIDSFSDLVLGCNKLVGRDVCRDLCADGNNKDCKAGDFCALNAYCYEPCDDQIKCSDGLTCTGNYCQKVCIDDADCVLGGRCMGSTTKMCFYPCTVDETDIDSCPADMRCSKENFCVPK